MKSLIDFTTGSLSSFGVLLSVDKQVQFDSISMDQGMNFLIALTVGVISTIVLNILRAKFPGMFKPVKRKNEDDSPV